MSNELCRKELDNGAILKVYDESKNVVGDRWMVRLRFVTILPWSSWMDDFLEAEGGDAETLQNDQGEFSFELNKERVFVEDDCKGEVVESIIAEMEVNILGYISRPSFIEKFFRKRFQEVLEQKKVSSRVSAEGIDAEEDKGPADFSECFK